MSDGEARLVGGRDILVVDDVAANLVAVEAALAPLKRQVVTAQSGSQALLRLLEDDYALILLDVQMPVMDGYETAQLIRSRDRSRHVPIIFMTAFSRDDELTLRAYQLGAVDFLFKPVQPEVLRAKAQVFVALQDRTMELASEQLRGRQRALEEQRQRFEAEALRRQMDREREAKEEFVRLNEQLALADRRKNEFLAMLAHELRNPLAPIRTSIDLIRRAPDDPVSPRILEIMDRQLDHTTRLVDDLLDISRISSGKLDLRTEPLDLAKVVDLAVTACKPNLDARGHSFEIIAAERPCIVIGDATRLVQVVSNLLNNAARYTRPGGSIQLAWYGTPDEAFIRVTDDGIGISREQIGRIFEMFVQEHAGGDGGGLGLGLALSRKLIDLHGGSIRATSGGRDQGSSFEIRLPIADPTISLLPAARREKPEPIKGAGRPLRLILVEDNDDIRELTASLLESHGHEVMTAHDGPSGLALICEHRPDVALVDIGLPGFDGFELARSLRERCPDLTTRLVAMTGYGRDSDRLSAYDAGFDVHIVKPATTTAILRALSVGDHHDA